MAYEKSSAKDITRFEDRIRTILEDLRKIRENLQENSIEEAELQLGSMDHFLMRMEKTVINARAKAEVLGRTVKRASVAVEKLKKSRKE